MSRLSPNTDMSTLVSVPGFRCSWTWRSNETTPLSVWSTGKQVDKWMCWLPPSIGAVGTVHQSCDSSSALGSGYPVQLTGSGTLVGVGVGVAVAVGSGVRVGSGVGVGVGMAVGVGIGPAGSKTVTECRTDDVVTSPSPTVRPTT